MSVESSYSYDDFFEGRRLKSLCLANCKLLRDENILLFTSIFPNLEVLDLSYWKGMCEEIVGLVLRCHNLKHMNLSYTDVDDKSLCLISKCFPMLLHLILEHCNDVTEKGLKHVVENCINLRELRHCYSKSDMLKD